MRWASLHVVKMLYSMNNSVPTLLALALILDLVWEFALATILSIWFWVIFPDPNWLIIYRPIVWTRKSLRTWIICNHYIRIYRGKLQCNSFATLYFTIAQRPNKDELCIWFFLSADYTFGRGLARSVEHMSYNLSSDSPCVIYIEQMFLKWRLPSNH